MLRPIKIIEVIDLYRYFSKDLSKFEVIILPVDLLELLCFRLG